MWERAFVARGFSETSHRPFASRSGPIKAGSATQPIGDKSPRHRVHSYKEHAVSGLSSTALYVNRVR